MFSGADAVSGKMQQKQAWKTGRYAGLQYSLSTDKKDSSTKKSYMGIVRKEKIGYSKDSYQIRNRSGVVCLLLSDSKFTLSAEKDKLTKSVFINIIDTDFCCQSVISKDMN